MRSYRGVRCLVAWWSLSSSLSPSSFDVVVAATSTTEDAATTTTTTNNNNNNTNTEEVASSDTTTSTTEDATTTEEVSSSSEKETTATTTTTATATTTTTTKTDADERTTDFVRDGMLMDPLASDPDCGEKVEECWSPPASTVEEVVVAAAAAAPPIDLRDIYGGEVDRDTDARDDQGRRDAASDDPPSSPSSSSDATCRRPPSVREEVVVADKHWGRDRATLRMRDALRDDVDGASSKRPPVFLLPGLASTRLVAWRHHACAHALVGDVRVQDHVWLNVGKLLEMATIDETCWGECMGLGPNQTDSGCKLRPDEGVDAISSLAPDSTSSNLVVGGTNTIYAWLTQWLADNLGYDVVSIVGLPYDWRLSPDVMEKRDGFLTNMRHRIEAAVESAKHPGVVVAHSMGNKILQYFLNWLRHRMKEEAYERYKRADSRRARRNKNHVGWGMDDADVVASSSSSVRPPRGDDVLRLDDDAGDDGVVVIVAEDAPPSDPRRERALRELAEEEGDAAFVDWVERHLWTYVGLSPPLLGAANSVRAVVSGEKMGLPMSESLARDIELSFGSTHTLSAVSTKTGFCDDDAAAAPTTTTTTTTTHANKERDHRRNLACLEDIAREIESSSDNATDPWADFPVLRAYLKDRVDYDTHVPFFSVRRERCRPGERPPCAAGERVDLSPLDVQSGRVFDHFAEVWREKGDPLRKKKEQLRRAWWDDSFPNILNSTWDRPLIKHVVMAYGIDRATEVGYLYRREETLNDDEEKEEKDETTESRASDNANTTTTATATTNATEEEPVRYDGIPTVHKVYWEQPGGVVVEENLDAPTRSLTDTVLLRRGPKKVPVPGVTGTGLPHSGDGSVPYVSLAWSHTWLLHGQRASRRGGDGTASSSSSNPLDAVRVDHRPRGGDAWKEGPPSSWTMADATMGRTTTTTRKEDADTGTRNPHGTKYKPEMVRYRSEGVSRTTGMEYTTTVLEAVGVEHKETTRNYDILAAVFTDVLTYMHDDLGIV